VADFAVTLNADEVQALIEEVAHVHDVEDFEGECPVCTAYRKLKEAQTAAGVAPSQAPSLPDVIEQIAQEWDGCEYDAPGGGIPIGDAIRAKGGRLLRERSLGVGIPQNEQEKS
jgi:hypothetical protein